VAVVEAVPEDKFNFSPESLNIKGANYKGVYTLAGQVKHVAAANFLLWGGAGGDKVPAMTTGLKGPESMTSKAEIVQRLRTHLSPGIMRPRR